MTLEPLVGIGTLRLALKENGLSTKATTVELPATAVGRDGSISGLSGNEPATVPVGEYRLGTVTVAFDLPDGSQRWSFIFSDNGAKDEPKWYSVRKDSSVTIDPIGTPSFEFRLTDNVKAVKSGEDISVQPMLFTGGGLLINVAYCGALISPSAQETLGARITLATTDG